MKMGSGAPILARKGPRRPSNLLCPHWNPTSGSRLKTNGLLSVDRRVLCCVLLSVLIIINTIIISIIMIIISVIVIII